MTFIIRQSSTPTIRIGPFVDATDGFTPETALTIAQADFRLSKNMGAFAQKNEATTATHEENGWYNVPLNATDTGTLGLLIVAVYASGARHVVQDYLVLSAMVYDSLVPATDTLDVQVTGIGANVITATSINADAITAAKVADGTIDAATFAAGAITATVLATDAITDAEISAAGANKIADHVLRRTYANARASANGDTLNFRSLLGAVGKLVNKIAISGASLLIYQEDDTTSSAPGGTQVLTTSASADHITGADTA